MPPKRKIPKSRLKCYTKKNKVFCFDTKKKTAKATKTTKTTKTTKPKVTKPKAKAKVTKPKAKATKTKTKAKVTQKQIADHLIRYPGHRSSTKIINVNGIKHTITHEQLLKNPYLKKYKEDFKKDVKKIQNMLKGGDTIENNIKLNKLIDKYNMERRGLVLDKTGIYRKAWRNEYLQSGVYKKK